jgi:hypothetical protein
MTTMKHISTATRAVAMLWVVIAIQPIMGVITAPPIIAMTKKDAPRVVFSPRFFRPSPAMEMSKGLSGEGVNEEFTKGLVLFYCVRRIREVMITYL